MINATKRYYRTELAKSILKKLDDDSNLTSSQAARQVTALNAIYLLDESWKKVSSQTIQNCWKHAGLLGRNGECQEEEEEEEEDDEEMADEMKKEIDDICTWGEELDAEASCHGLLTEEQIIMNIMGEGEINDNESDREEEEEVPIPSNKETRDALEILRRKC